MHVGLIIGSVLQIVLGGYMYWLGSVYAFSAEATTSWLVMVVMGVVVLIIGIYLKASNVTKNPKWIFPIYSTFLLITLIFVQTNLPTYTYLQAVEIVEKATGERGVVANEKEKTNYHISYYIYTAGNVYLFNNDSGEFVIYERDD